MCVHSKMNQIGRLMLMITAGVMVAGLLVAHLNAQSFQVSQNGKSVGTATLSLKQAGQGFDASSGVKIDMPGLKYTFSSDQALDSGYHLTKVDLKGSVNGTAATVNTVAQSRQGQTPEFVMTINANGKVINTPLDFHRYAIFFPDFDPGALQILLNIGAAHNNRDLWALIPKQTGSVAALRVETKADEQGTLDGRQITVHHLTVSSDTDTTEIFSSPSNELLQAEWTKEGFALVRQGFKLTPPKHPPTAPPPQPQQQPQDQQPQQQQ
jgi:hypothetical protein